MEEFDFETGRLLDVLDELKLTQNTMVIYTSDNGPWNQDKYTKYKKGHPKESIFWGILVLSGMAKARVTKADTGCLVSLNGGKKLSQELFLMQFLRQ